MPILTTKSATYIVFQPPMVAISCLVCGNPVELPQYIDIENCDGEVVCQKCESLLHIKLVKSKVQKYRVVEKNFRILSGDEIDRILERGKKAEQEFRNSQP